MVHSHVDVLDCSTSNQFNGYTHHQIGPKMPEREVAIARASCLPAHVVPVVHNNPQNIVILSRPPITECSRLPQPCLTASLSKATRDGERARRKHLVSSHRTVEPVGPPLATRSTASVMTSGGSSTSKQGSRGSCCAQTGFAAYRLPPVPTSYVRLLPSRC